MELQKEIHLMKRKIADHEQNRNQSQEVMKKKDYDSKKLKDKITEF